jgi:hypothetical protein
VIANITNIRATPAGTAANFFIRLPGKLRIIYIKIIPDYTVQKVHKLLLDYVGSFAAKLEVAKIKKHLLSFYKKK